jgi:tetratricopeptide (TPR) repeat protein
MRYIFIFSLLVLIGSSCSLLKEKRAEDPERNNIVNIDLNRNDSLKYKYVFFKALKSKYTGSLSEALQYFDYCNNLNPTASEPYYQMSLIADRIDEIKDALKYGRKAVQFSSDNKWYRLHLANLHIRRNQLDSAIIQYEYLARMKPENLDFQYHLANLYNENGQYEKALQYYKKIEDNVGLNKEIAIRKQQMYSKIGEKEKAIKEIENLIENSSTDARLYGILAELYASYNMYDKAEQMYAKLFAIDSTNNMGQMSMIRFYQQNNKYQKAIETYYKIIENKSIRFGSKMLVFINLLNKDKKILSYSYELEECLNKLSSQYPDRVEVHTLFADLFLKLNQFNKAAKHLRILAYSDKSKQIYWDQLLSVYSFQGKFQELYEDGKKAIKEFSKEPRLFFLTSIGANQIGKSDSAVYYLHQGMNFLSPGNQKLRADYYAQLAEAYHNLEKHKKSDTYFEKALKIQPDNQFLLNNYSYYLSLRNEKLDMALKYSGKTIEKEPNNSVYLDTYAWILYKLGKYRKSMKYIEKAIENNGSGDGDILEHYGDILYKNGNVEQAIEQWKKARKKGRDSEDLDYKIKNEKLPE